MNLKTILIITLMLISCAHQRQCFSPPKPVIKKIKYDLSSDGRVLIEAESLKDIHNLILEYKEKCSCWR